MLLPEFKENGLKTVADVILLQYFDGPSLTVEGEMQEHTIPNLHRVRSSRKMDILPLIRRQLLLVEIVTDTRRRSEC
jgi:hypothetical protein